MARASIQQDISRRQFLSRTFKIIIAVASATLAYPLLRFTEFSVKPKPRHIVVRKHIPVGGSYTEHDFILFISKEGPFALSRRCTHLGCKVLYRQEFELIECPCHQSRFDLSGKRVAGPAKGNLTVYPVRVLEDDAGNVNGYEVTI